MKKIKRNVMLCFLIIMSFLMFSGCAGVEGYGVLLWSIPEYGLSDGDIVPVYLRSNISQIYAIGVPETNEKIEIPLWQITIPESKRKATKKAEQYVEYKHQYASVKIDGLAIREEAENTSDQLYRLRESEIVKVLYQGEGQAVMRGSEELEGEWLRVLTQEGTEGWCYSYNLSVYDEREGFQAQVIDVSAEADEAIQQIAQKTWYPDYYATMLNENRVDLKRIRSDFGFDPGLVTGTISLASEAIQETFSYDGITKKSEGSYAYTDNPLTLTIKDENNILVEYMDEVGRRTAYGFVSLSSEDGTSTITSVSQIIANENARRTNLYRDIQTAANRFHSSNYGTITFSASETFEWRDFDRLLTAGLVGIPRDGDSIGRGSVSIEYFAQESMLLEFDGILTLRFDTSRDEFNVLYKLEEDGLRFETVENIDIKEGVLIERSSNPMVLFFRKR